MIPTCCRNPKHPFDILTTMFVTKLNDVSWLLSTLLQVPYWKVFTQINSKKFAQSCSKLFPSFTARWLIRFFLGFNFAWSFFRRLPSSLFFVKIQLAPLDLGDTAGALLIPNRSRACEVPRVHTIIIRDNYLPYWSTWVCRK